MIGAHTPFGLSSWKVQATGCGDPSKVRQPACDQIVHTVVDIVSVPNIHRINRPTWQQVVQVAQ